MRRRDSRRRLRSDEHARRSATRCEGKKGDETVIEFGCRDRDSMGKVSGDLGFRDDLSPTIKNIFSAWFVLVNFRAVTAAQCPVWGL